MNRIRPYLLIGGVRDTQDLRLLEYYGVGAMLQLAAHVEHEQISSLYLPIDDGIVPHADFLDRAIAYIRDRKAENCPTLVACGLGVSRSATVVIAAVKELEGCDLRTALREVRVARPEARPHPVLWKALCERYGEDISYREVVLSPTPQPPPSGVHPGNGRSE